MIYEDLIDDYLFGRILSEQEQSFLSECRTNQTLKEEAVAMAYLVKGLKSIH
jgi:hypothetical protein